MFTHIHLLTDSLMFVKGYIHILSFDCTFLDSVTSSLHKLSLSKLTGLSQRHLMSEHLEDPLSSLNPLNVNKPWPGWERRATALVCTYIHHIKNTCVYAACLNYCMVCFPIYS